MNLELLDPFGRQVPDRIDATLQIPNQTNKGAATALCFNRRGTYLAVGYADGSVAVHSTLTRTLTAVYLGVCVGGVSSLSWSRRSRRLLVGAMGDSAIKLIDTTHPAGSEVASELLMNLASTKSFAIYDPDSGSRMDASERSSSKKNNTALNRISASSSSDSGVILPQHAYFHTEKTSFKDVEDRTVVLMRESRKLGISETIPQSYKEPKQFHSVTIPIPSALGHALQIHPDGIHGLAVCEGILYIISVIPDVFCEAYQPTDSESEWLKPLRVSPGKNLLATDDIVCATFGHDDNSIIAVRESELLVFQDIFCRQSKNASKVQRISTDCANPWHLIRHRKQLLLNGGDGVLRLYDTTSLKSGPLVQFQDSVTKAKFADATISGDGEHVVAVVNSDTMYEMYIWNALTGVLVDKLSSQSRLSSVGWHPVRSFVVGACEDGIVDVWGPRINWTAFAPDFQALPQNVEYIEREDEFDLDAETGIPVCKKDAEMVEDESVEVLKVDPVPVFASDSEDESDVFEFDTRMKNIIAAKGDGKKGKYANAGDD